MQVSFWLTDLDAIVTFTTDAYSRAEACSHNIQRPLKEVFSLGIHPIEGLAAGSHALSPVSHIY